MHDLILYCTFSSAAPVLQDVAHSKLSNAVTLLQNFSIQIAIALVELFDILLRIS